MKKYIKQIAILAAFAAFASCSNDELESDFASVGGNVIPETANISRLDKNYDIPFDLITKKGVTVSKIEIYKDGDKISDAAISGESAIFNTSALGSFDEFPDEDDNLIETTGKFALEIVSTYSDGSTTKAPYNLTVGKGIVWKVLNAAGNPNTTSATSGKTTVKFNDPTPVNIYYATIKKSTTAVDNVIGEWSKNGGAYTALPDTFSTEKQTVNIAAIPYSTYGGIIIGDKITYRFTVNAGTQSDVISTTIQFANQIFTAEKSGTISNQNDTKKFSFFTGTNYDYLNTENGEIAFSSSYGIEVDGTTDIQFVKSSLNYDTADLFAVDAAYNSGTKVASINNLTPGDVVLYKITRKVNSGTLDEPVNKNVTSYGILKINDKIQGTVNEALKFSYKEGVLSI